VLHLRLDDLWRRAVVLWGHSGRLLSAARAAESGSKAHSTGNMLRLGVRLALALATCGTALR